MTRKAPLSTVVLLASAVSLAAQDLPSLVLKDGGIQFPDDTILSSAVASYQQVLVVAKSGGHFASIQAALDSITDASSDNRYLVWIAPGTYTERVTLKEHVYLRGSGSGLTTITSPGSAAPDTGTVVGAQGSGLRDLTVFATGAGENYAIAVYNLGVGTMHLRDVSAASASALVNFGVFNELSDPRMTDVFASGQAGLTNYGVYNRSGSSPQMTDVAASALGGGTSGEMSYAIYNENGSDPTIWGGSAACAYGGNCYGVFNLNARPSISGLSIVATLASTANYGVWNSDSSPGIRNVKISALGAGSVAVFNEGTSSPIIRHSVLVGGRSLEGGTPHVVYSQLVGPAAEDLSEGTCLGAYDGDFEPLDSRCAQGSAGTP